jgi:hypothetical protein
MSNLDGQNWPAPPLLLGRGRVCDRAEWPRLFVLAVGADAGWRGQFGEMVELGAGLAKYITRAVRDHKLSSCLTYLERIFSIGPA